MTTDTSEKGLERLICTALTGHPCDPPSVSAGPTAASRHPGDAHGGSGWIGGSPGDYDREYCVDLVAACRLPPGDPAQGRRGARPGTGRSDTAQVPRPPARGDQQAGHDRRPAPRHQARTAPRRSLLRHAVARQRQGPGALRRQPLFGHAPAPLQPGRDAAGARPGPLHQRPAGGHLRAEEQPHQADRRGCGRAVQARPRPARAALRVRALRGPFRRGRPRGALLHPPQGQGLLVSALQPRLERRRGQPAQPGRDQDRLPLEAHPHPRGADGHPGELRPGRRNEGREDRPEEAGADLAALPPARRGAQAPGRCGAKRCGTALSDPALGGQRQEQLHRLARPPADRPAKGTTNPSSTRSSSSPTGASSTSRSATRSSNSPRSARRSAR